MAHFDTLDTSGEGNTKSSPSPTTSLDSKAKSRGWCFTENNYDEKFIDTMTHIFSTKKWSYIMGKEIGTEGTHHIQGYICHKNAIRFSTLKKMMPRAHLEKAKGSKKQNYNYCSKDGNFITNMDFKTFQEQIIDKCLESYKNVKWRPFQQQVLNIISKPTDSRKIHWFYEKNGNVGKSFLAKYILMKHKGVIICSGKKNDVFNQVLILMEKKILPEIILLDIPRTDMDYLNYSTIEQLKNGFLYSGKYEGGVCIFPSPKIICFSNNVPEKKKLSLDRWNIIHIDSPLD